MNSVILSLLLLSIALLIFYIKDFFCIFVMVSMILMLSIDASVIYLFYKLGIEKIDIAIGIFLGTILKVLFFALITKTNE
jgi:hypothetical protein